MTRTLFLGLSVGLGLICLASCSAAKDGPRGPVENVAGRHQTSSTATTATAAASASTKPPAGPQDVAAWPCDSGHEHRLEDRRLHALSQRVPDRACREDRECGDGFCDRGRCAPIWEDRYGQRCTMTCQCGPFLCLEGRCRSCLHHTECVENGNSCGWYEVTTTFSLGCGFLGPHETHLPPDPVRQGPPPTQ
jgi:hypothetical protein